MKQQLLDDILAGELSKESQEAFIQSSMERITHGTIDGFTDMFSGLHDLLRNMRDEHIIFCWEFMGRPSQAQFYKQLQLAERLPRDPDPLMLMLNKCHQLNDKFNLPVPKPRQLSNICNP